MVAGELVVAGAGDQDHDGHTGARADLLGDDVDRAGDGVLFTGDAGQGGGGHRGEVEALADAAEHQARQDVLDVAAVERGGQPQAGADADQDEADRHQGARGPAGEQAAGGEVGGEEDRRRHRHQGESGLEGRVVQHALEVEGREEQHPDRAHVLEERREARGPDRGQPEEAEREGRVGGAALADDEQRQGDRGGGEQDPDRGAVATDADDQQGEADGAGDRAGQVQPAAVAGAVGQAGPGRGQHGEAEQDREPQHRTPAPELGQHAAQHHPAAEAGRADGRVDAEGPVAGRTGREGLGEQGQGGRSRQGGADALGGTRAQQDGGVRRGCPDQRGHREQGHAGLEHPSPAQHIGQPAAHQQEAGEGDGVGGHHPLERGVGQIEPLPH